MGSYVILVKHSECFSVLSRKGFILFNDYFFNSDHVDVSIKISLKCYRRCRKQYFKIGI